MPKIKFIDYDGDERIIDANIGDSVMQVATQNDVPGIDADCGGACSCATCHVYVNEEWMAHVGNPEEVEAEMLDVVDEKQDNSRLACQITVSDELDGLIVTTPESQF